MVVSVRRDKKVHFSKKKRVKRFGGSFPINFKEKGAIWKNAYLNHLEKLYLWKTIIYKDILFFHHLFRSHKVEEQDYRYFFCLFFLQKTHFLVAPDRVWNLAEGVTVDS